LRIFGEKVTCPKPGEMFNLLIGCGSHKPLLSLEDKIIDDFYCHIFLMFELLKTFFTFKIFTFLIIKGIG